MTVTSNIKVSQRAILLSIIAIFVLTVLEFPAPIGFETRPQGNVSLGWLFLFLTIIVSEIIALLTIFKRAKIGAKFGLVAAILNIFQVIADQTHMMQPEVAPFGYTLLELSVAVLSILIAYFSIKILKNIS